MIGDNSDTVVIIVRSCMYKKTFIETPNAQCISHSLLRFLAFQKNTIEPSTATKNKSLASLT